MYRNAYIEEQSLGGQESSIKTSFKVRMQTSDRWRQRPEMIQCKRKALARLKHRETKAAVEQYKRKERIQCIISHGEGDVWLGMENTGVGNMMWLAVNKQGDTPLNFSVAVGGPNMNATWQKDQFWRHRLRYGKWSLCTCSFWIEGIVRLVEASAKGEPWCLWPIRSQ